MDDLATWRVNHSGGWPHQTDFRRSSDPCFSVGTQQRGNAYPGLLGRRLVSYALLDQRQALVHMPCGRAGPTQAFPFARALAKPERTRSRISSRSNSATADRRCAIMRPMGVLMSICPGTTKVTPSVSSSAMVRMRSCTLRPQRSSLDEDHIDSAGTRHLQNLFA
ncbi:hypothetical protein DLNHIDIE_03445 [Acidithiobacillus thiooxidans ATCC 19377]|uniref:Uncharacterized protein n=1 Tax=Acidithiobacillus thiooxidans ATCC 19377 TaxID=637390 RepID=A0A543PYV2_ACITH|nr:hypothetical protein DLNHIDIE_03445 [Acidithiobacillus thiooxidans ATCC 19377]